MKRGEEAAAAVCVLRTYVRALFYVDREKEAKTGGGGGDGESGKIYTAHDVVVVFLRTWLDLCTNNKSTFEAAYSANFHLHMYR